MSGFRTLYTIGNVVASVDFFYLFPAMMSDGICVHRLSPVHTGDSPKTATVTDFGDCCRIRRQI